MMDTAQKTVIEYMDVEKLRGNGAEPTSISLEGNAIFRGGESGRAQIVCKVLSIERL